MSAHDLCKAQCNSISPCACEAQVETELKAAGLGEEAISSIMAAMQVRSVHDLQSLLGNENKAVQQLQRLFELAAGYGYDDWLVFDASIVRGLAYYTGELALLLELLPLSCTSFVSHASPFHTQCYCFQQLQQGDT